MLGLSKSTKTNLQGHPTPLHLRVFLSSPGDVANERALALQVLLQEIPYKPALRERVSIEVVAWDHPGAKVPMRATIAAQESVNISRLKPSECDIVVVILWSRLGSPIESEEYRKLNGGYFTGTEWEYEDARRAKLQIGRPEILLYHRTEKLRSEVDPDDLESIEEIAHQLRRVRAFLNSCRERDGSIPNKYSSPGDFKNDLAQHLEELILELIASRAPVIPKGEAKPTPLPLKHRWKGSPFPGLRAFTAEDAPIFFGRDRETDALIKILTDRACRFIGVVGASGSGKSSLVAGGLLPRLHSGAIEGSQDWISVQFTPGEVGDNPFTALAVKLAPYLKKRTRDLANVLRKNPDEIIEHASRVLEDRPDWAQLLLFIDQFEELFTMVDPQYQEPFIDLLEAASQAERIRTIVTLRADFYHHCLKWPKLTELLNNGSYSLASPWPDALHKMIIKPAERAGLSLDEKLVDGKRLIERILEDTGMEPGALPMMAFALSELHASRTQSGQLTHAAYENFKGVKGAIGQRAEETVCKLRPAVRAALSNVFRELIEVDEQGIATRRRALRSHLDISAEATELVEKLIDGRLLVSGQGDRNKPVVEVAHEALLTHWSRLAQWIKDYGEDLRLFRQMKLAAADWDRKGRVDHYLWPVARWSELDTAVERLHFSFKEFSRIERDFGFKSDPKFMLRELNPKEMLAELAGPTTHHERRLEIGKRLAELGDSRFGIGVDNNGIPDIDWVGIPRGHIFLENNARSFDVNPFYISRYPVTYRQYRAFLKAGDGYREKQWWDNLEHRQTPGKQQWPIDNHPADNVSWYDSIAFCRWLSAKLNYEVRLPTEWEWQQAAIGGNTNYEYPWGPEWKNGYANTDEAGLGQTTAVGMYPPGRTAQGVLDMSGNVWEWCLNKYNNPKDTSIGGYVSRVVRGGSWYHDRGYALATVRHPGRPLPDYRRYGIGFRLCCSAPIK